MNLIFVYGTLKNGHVRHSALRNQRYIGVATTQPLYKMYHFRGYPALIEDEQVSPIYGELYEVTTDCIQELDNIEGVGQGLFVRKEIKLDTFNFVNLPIFASSWAQIEAKKAECYFFQNEAVLQGAKNCGSLWSK